MKTNFALEIHEIVFRVLQTIFAIYVEKAAAAAILRKDVDNVEETNVNVMYDVVSIPRRRIFVCCNNYNGKVETCIVSFALQISHQLPSTSSPSPFSPLV